MTAVKERMALDFETIVRQHQAGVWRYLRFLGAERSEADDLTQDTFLALFRSNFEHRTPGETSGYLRAVARNQLLQFRRRQGKELNTVQMEVAESVWAEADQDDGLAGFLSALDGCLEKLDGKARDAVDLFYRQGLGREAVGKRMEMKPDGVKSLLRRTRAILRDCVSRSMRE